ncbi:hypothetical protein [Asaia bogorensis]|uniref:hypothetical protein n=1 Tax=Asaia bogorensis TaxID=91915 RepID=UPI0011BFB24F|nr:hypothetical protein [Asaia bogorensis]
MSRQIAASRRQKGQLPGQAGRTGPKAAVFNQAGDETDQCKGLIVTEQPQSAGGLTNRATGFVGGELGQAPKDNPTRDEGIERERAEGHMIAMKRRPTCDDDLKRQHCAWHSLPAAAWNSAKRQPHDGAQGQQNESNERKQGNS